jgi:hypothetical protein
LEKSAPFMVLIPTTQIFLACDATFDRTSFVTARKVAYGYPSRDVADRHLIPKDEGEFLLRQASVYAGASPDLLALVRAHRNSMVESSMGPCSDYRRELAARLSERLSCADRGALRYYFATELGVGGRGWAEMLGALRE